MSKTIDERIVSMQFDNKNFESNVQTSMSTLDKLKQKLHLPGASKGLEDVASSAKKVDLNPIGKAAETVQVKFTAMQTIADQALRNITNSAMAAGKKMLSALTIDPITSGFKEYETQINAVQTILANTKSKGTTIDDVNKALEELNKYADMTIYNFTEMTRNIGTFTAAGIDLENSTKSIKGIANLAAVSGASSQQASTAMYQLSQALSSGVVKLQDWNSVVNAQMGGQVFQDALKETARVHGINVDAIIKKNGSFRESLKAGWMSAEVLTETLEKFTATTEGLTEEQIKANREMWKSKGYTDEQIDNIFELGKTATDAATKVKTFTQLFDVMKEAAQSGWAKSWKIIIGDFEEAKELLTPLADFFTKIINKISDWRNAILDTAFAKTFRGLADSLNDVLSPITTVKDALYDLDEIARRVIRGDFKNQPFRFGLLEAEGYDSALVQNRVNEMLGDPTRHVSKHANAQKEAAEATGELTEAQTKQIIELAKLSDAELENLGWNKKQIKALRQLQKEADRLGLSFEFFMKNIDKINGRWALIEAFKNLKKAVSAVINPIKQAWREIFKPISGKGLYNAIAAFYKFSKSLIISEETGDKLRRTFKGVFAVLDLVRMVISGGFKIVFAVIKGVAQALGYIDIDILWLTARIGDFLVKIRDWIKSHDILVRVVARVIAAIIKLGKAFIELLKKLYRLPPVQKVVTSIANAFRKMKDYIKGAAKSTAHWLDNIESITFEDVKNGLKKTWEWIKKIFKKIQGLSFSDIKNKFLNVVESIKNGLRKVNDYFGGVPGDIIKGLVNGLSKGAKKAWEVISNVAKGLIDFFCKILGIHSPSTVFIAIGGFIIAGLIGGLLGGEGSLSAAATGLAEKLKTAFMSIDWGVVFAGIASIGMISLTNKLATFAGNLTAPLQGLADAMSGVGEFLSKTATGFNRLLKGAGKALKGIGRAATGLGAKFIGQAVMSLAISIAILVGCLWLITKIDTGAAWKAIGVLAVLVGMIAGIILAIGYMGKSLVGAKISVQFGAIALAIFGIATALILMAFAIKILSSISFGKALGSIILLGAMISSIAMLMRSMGMFLDGKAAADIRQAGKVIRKIATTLLLMTLVVAILGMLPESVVSQGRNTMAAFVAMISVLMIVGTYSDKTIYGIGQTIRGVASAMFSMALVVLILGSIKMGTLIQGYIGVMLLATVVGVIMSLTKLIGGKAKSIAVIGKTIRQLGTAMLLLSLVVVILGSIKFETMMKGILGVALLSVVIAGLIYATQLGSTKKLRGVISTLLVASMAIMMLAAVAVILGMIPLEILIKGTVMVAIFGVLVMGIIAVTKMSQNRSGMLWAVVAAIAIMAIAVGVLGNLEPKKLLTSVAALTMIMTVMGILIGITNKAKTIKKFNTNLLVVMGAMLGIGIILAVMARMPLENTVGAAVALSLAMIALSAVMVMMGSFDKIIGSAKQSILAMLAICPVLLAIAFALSLIPVSDSGVLAAMTLSTTMVAMASLLVILSKIKATDSKKAMKSMTALIALAGVMVVFAAAIALLSVIPLTNEAVVSVMIISTIMAAFTLLMPYLAAVGKTSKSAAKGITNLTLMVVPLLAFAVALAALSYIPIKASVIPAVIGVSLLMYAMASLLPMVAAVGKTSKSAVKGITNLTLMVAPLLAFSVALAAMSAMGVDNAIQNAIALSVLIAACCLMLPILAIAGAPGISIAALAGIGLLSLMIAPMLLFITALKKMDDVKNLTTNVLAMIGLMTTITTLAVILGIASPLIILATVAIGLLTVMMTTMLGLVTTIGLIFDCLPFLKKFVNTGIKILITLAEGIGEMIAAFAEGLTSRLPSIGENLSKFMKKAELFFKGVSTMPDNIIGKIGQLVVAIMALAVANFIEGVFKVLSLGTSFSRLGTHLSKFMKNGEEFFTKIKDVNPAVLTGVKHLAQAIDIMTSSSFLDRIGEFIFGSSGLEHFGSRLGTIAEGLSTFRDKLGTFTDGDVKTVSFAAEAIKDIATAFKNIPKEGGLTGWFSGDVDYKGFADQLPKFADGVSKFANAITIDGSQVDQAKAGIDVVVGLAEAAQKVPKIGGFLQSWEGTPDLAGFASTFESLGSAVSAFINSTDLTGEDAVVKAEAAKVAVGVITELAKAAQTIDSLGDLEVMLGDDKLAGLQGFIDFIELLPDLGTAVGKFVTNFDTSQDITNSTVYIDMVVDFINSLAGLFDNTKLHKKGKSTIGDAISQISSNLGTFGNELKDFIANINGIDPEKVQAAIDTINKVTEYINSIPEETKDVTGQLEESMGGLSDNAITSFSNSMSGEEALDKVKTAVQTVLDAVIDKVGANKTAKSTPLDEPFKKLAESAIAQFSSDSSLAAASTAGANVTKGLAKGLKDPEALTELKLAAQSLVSLVKTTVENAAVIESPSKLFRKVGQYIPMGFALGLTDMNNKIETSATTMADTAIDTVKHSIARVASGVFSDIDSQPTIRPVLDMSDVMSGANAINGLFTDPALGMAGTISNSMNKRQNRNADVVSAIESLRRDLGNAGGTTYSINGVTYNGDGDVAQAIKTLTRAAIRERRI